jgi:hypothetical protein
MKMAMTTRNTVITVCTPWTVVSRSALMSVSMTFMLEPAKLQMNCASANGTSMRLGDHERTPLSGPRPEVNRSTASSDMVPPHPGGVAGGGRV